MIARWARYVWRPPDVCSDCVRTGLRGIHCVQSSEFSRRELRSEHAFREANAPRLGTGAGTLPVTSSMVTSLAFALSGTSTNIASGTTPTRRRGLNDTAPRGSAGEL